MTNCPHCRRTLALKVYIASRYEDRDEAIELKKWLEQHGFTVVAQWLTPKDDNQPMSKIKEDRALCGELGDRAVQDIFECDVLVAMSPRKAHGNGTGGRHVELGIAIGFQRGTVVLGEPENVFHFRKQTVLAFDRAYLPKAIALAYEQARTDSLLKGMLV
jgi:hypothetical protein